jgi:hypothetical protein
MKRSLLAAGAAALALSLPAAAVADGVNRRPAVQQPRPKPAAKPVRHRAKPAPQRQVRHAPARHNAARHSHAAVTVDWEKLETHETRVYEERNGYSYGPVVGYSERYIAPSRGCYPQAPCGYSTGTHAGYGMAHGAGYGHDHSVHHGGAAYGHDHAIHHGAAGVTVIRPGFGHGPLTGGVGYGVDGGPVYGATVVVPGGGFVSGGRFSSGRSFSSGYASSSASAYSSAQAQGGGYYNYGTHGSHRGHHGQGGHQGGGVSYNHPGASGHAGFGYGATYGHGGSGYLGFKPSAHGQGIGATGYTGFRR